MLSPTQSSIYNKITKAKFYIFVLYIFFYFLEDDLLEDLEDNLLEDNLLEDNLLEDLEEDFLDKLDDIFIKFSKPLFSIS